MLHTMATTTRCEVKTARGGRPGTGYVIVNDPEQGWAALTFDLVDIGLD